MQIEYKKIEDIKEYENNARFNEDAVNYVANSIKQFGFKVPIVIDKNNTIIIGHTRYKASLLLGLKEVPTIKADDLNEEQIRMFRIVDNKSSEYAKWDYNLLDDEIEGINNINMEDFGFEEEKIDWDSIEELNEDTYDKPQHTMCQCPFCNHIDRSIHFKKVKE